MKRHGARSARQTSRPMSWLPLREGNGPGWVALREFAKSPLTVGSPFVATHWLVNRVCDQIDWHDIEAVAEFGPGGGPFTTEILRRLPRGGQLTAFETGAGFVQHLRKRFRGQPFKVIPASATKAGHYLRARSIDCIISGIPFSTMSQTDAANVMRAARSLLKVEGCFIAYQMRPHVGRLLRRHFLHVAELWEWRNVPPCRIYVAHGLRR